MGFTKKQMKQRVVFSPILKPFANSITYKLVQTFSNIKPSSDTWRKLGGIIQFYLEAC
jgi:hypothetical protein